MSTENIKLQRGYDINQKALEFFKKNLNDRRVVLYLKERKLDKKSIEKFEIGFSGIGLVKYLTSNGFTEEEIVEWGLAKRRSDNTLYDYFINRVMFPIKDADGRIIGFSGRKISEDDEYSKYLNSKESELFKKGNILYNIDSLKNSIPPRQEIVLVEGFMDVISLGKIDLDNVVCTMGTTLTKEHIVSLKNISNKINLAFDNDVAGINATIEAGKKLIKEGFDVRVTKITGGKDFDEIINKKPECARDLIKNSKHFLIYFKNLIFDTNNFLDNFDTKLIEKILDVLILEIVRLVDLGKSYKNIFYMTIGELSYFTGVDYDVIESEFWNMVSKQIEAKGGNTDD